ncbi:MAG: gliding motility lipoprotein GldH [Ferruginibacter sp.]
MNLSRISVVLLFFALPAALLSCKQVELYEKNTPIPNYEWSSGYAATGTFHITDTVSSYNIYIVLRHTDAYNYNNIWMNIGLQAPGDSLRYQKVDLSLGNDATGWDGTGMNDIWEVRKPLALNKRFIKMGEYRFSILQIMREDPLKNVMSAGLRVEKTK